MEEHLARAIGLTLFAGLSTGLGSLVVIFSRRPSLRLLSFGLGFASGVMVYVSLVELLPQAMRIAGGQLGESAGGWLSLAAFFGGIGLSALIDRLVPEPSNPHEPVAVEDMRHAGEGDEPWQVQGAEKLGRVGLLTAVAISIHNVPEGAATFLAASSSASLGLSIAVAVAIHNIPEGMSVAVLVHSASGSRAKAVLYSFLSGLAEPLGGLLVYLALASFMTDAVMASMLAAVSGIMVYISFDELLPTAREYDRGHTVIVGVVAGMAVMAASLMLLR